MVNTHIGNRAHISASENYKVYGNIMSIGCGDNFRNNAVIPNICKNLYFGMFSEGVSMPDYSSSLPNPTLTRTLIDAKHLALPATILSDRCYDSMFDGCTSLENGPEELPATTLARWCYDQMFKYCHSLQKAPELHATTLPYACYVRMFYDCTSLTTAPELPATNIAGSCYGNMFEKCSSLTTTPLILPATNLSGADSCYSGMFNGCTSLTKAPTLPATTLANSCYQSMFNGCSSLTTAPELPAITLVYQCYRFMFYNCSNLNYIKCLAVNGINQDGSTSYWVNGVASSGTFVKDANMTGWTTGVNGIPTNWTVEDAQ